MPCSIARKRTRRSSRPHLPAVLVPGEPDDDRGRRPLAKRRKTYVQVISLLSYLLVRYQTKGEALINRTVTAVLDAPKDVVFDYLSQLDNLPEWATDFAQELKYVDGKAKGRQRPR